MKRSILFFAFLLPLIASAQVQVSGRVVGEKLEGVPSASITIKGSFAGTKADSAGNFSILVNQSLPFKVSVTSVGYSPLIYVVKDAASATNLVLQLKALFETDTVVITSRRRREVLQDVPIPITVIGGKQVEDAGAFNVNRVKELIPSVQLYTSNPRNTGVNIRGLGSPFGLTNDGLDPGVGIYVDGVYYARPAAATFDFIDVDQIEVLRGPQGTLYGKNTTAGAISITSRKPSFRPGATFEVSYGNYGYVQAKTSITGPISKRLAGRFSFSGTQRDGLIENVRTLKHTNDINNLGFRGQLLYKLSDKTSITLSGDDSRQRPDGYAQVIAGVAPTKRPGYRQFDSIITALNYQLPSRNAFDRKIDHDVPWNSNTDLGGVALNVDSKIGPGTLTSTTAWRYWNWDPSNDRDFTGLQALAKSQNPAKHKNWSQEFRYAGEFSPRLSGVVGLFYIDQEVKITGTEESGKDQWRFSQSSTSNLWKTPGLLDGFGIRTNASIKSKSAAVFANVDWAITDKFHVLPGVRYNYDEKDVNYKRATYGGLDTATYAGTTATKTTLQGFKNGVYTNQAYTAYASENNFTYQLTLSYKPTKRINAFATYSTSFKPVGVNVAGLPNLPNGRPDSSVAVIKPEDVKSIQVGIKTTLVDNLTLNFTFHNTDIKNYQTNVQSAQLGVNRGYIANAEKVNVKGFELDANYKATKHFSFSGALSYTDAKYVTFINAPLPLEKTGLKTTVGNLDSAFVDISGATLPGISKWSGSVGGEYITPVAFLGSASNFFVAAEAFYRSSFSSAATPSPYLNIDGYALVNGRIGFKTSKGLSAYIWGRNLFNKNYYEQLLIAGGNAGQIGAVLGDQRTYGVTLRYTY
ncbi:TonB-dependent receptor [Ferruginibacter lapsinanis]|uniref:TonB-dependent receptor n=1 Tax=Ferruginibacter lapsinanis TaxID=563172 RepID=UPI001E42B41E|nr:TonB-dependent receptor [Ferruginibacter lapsinanis]UEG49000.1 TonB-dependent receptor [Ferruginibacter lapsinanis]